jgi:hypothetical protein
VVRLPVQQQQSRQKGGASRFGGGGNNNNSGPFAVTADAAPAAATWLYTFDRMLVGTIELAPLPTAINGSVLQLLHGEWIENGVPVNSGSIQKVRSVEIC